MKNKNEVIGTISGVELLKNRSGKLNRSDSVVQSGTGYHKDKNKYNRKGKKNQQLKNQLKGYGSKAVFLCFYSKVHYLLALLDYRISY